MNKFILLLILTSNLLLTVSCSKKLSARLFNKDKGLDIENIDFEYFETKSRIKYQEGKRKLKERIKKRYPWMKDQDAEKLADDIMREMSMSEAQKLGYLEEEKKEKEAEDLVKDICERTAANCDPEEPKEDEPCGPQQ